jgi:anti-anti-sigma factor
MQSTKQRAYRRHLQSLLSGAVESVVVDLSAVTSIDSTELAELVQFSRRCEDAGKSCTFVLERRSGIARILTIAGLERKMNLRFTAYV